MLNPLLTSIVLKSFSSICRTKRKILTLTFPNFLKMKKLLWCDKRSEGREICLNFNWIDAISIVENINSKHTLKGWSWRYVRNNLGDYSMESLVSLTSQKAASLLEPISRILLSLVELFVDESSVVVSYGSPHFQASNVESL